QLRIAPLGDVAGDLGEADDLAQVVVDGVDADMRPEAAAILAHPPGFLLDPPGRSGNVEGLFGLARRPILGGMEAREMFTDDLVGSVALDPLCAQVPAADAPLTIEHVDGVVRDPLNQQAKLLLAAAQ